MRDDRHQPPRRFGQLIVLGARIGAIAGLLSALVVAMFTAVTVGEPLDQLLPSSIPHLIDGVAAGAAVGAVAVALRMRVTLDPKGQVVRLHPAVIPHRVSASPAERSSGGALEPLTPTRPAALRVRIEAPRTRPRGLIRLSTGRRAR